MTPQAQTKLFRVLSNERRVRIFALLMGSDVGMSSGYISDVLGIPPGPTSHNLQRLAEVKLVTFEKSSRNVFYYPERDVAADLADSLLLEPEESNGETF